jgi:hypothetical protein
MVRKTRNRAFWRGETGAVLVEALLVMPILLIVFAALIEFGFAVFQWNQAVKALQLGARLAAVSDPLPTDMTALTADYPEPQGGATPSDPVTISCGAGTTACNAVRLNRLVYGSDGTCDSSFGTSLPGMCDFNPHIKPENVRVSYSRSGLGYVGRPAGPVVTITVELHGLHFTLPFLGALLGVNGMDIPAHPVTVTSEDLCSSASC